MKTYQDVLYVMKIISSNVLVGNIRNDDEAIAKANEFCKLTKKEEKLIRRKFDNNKQYNLFLNHVATMSSALLTTSFNEKEFLDAIKQSIRLYDKTDEERIISNTYGLKVNDMFSELAKDVEVKTPLIPENYSRTSGYKEVNVCRSACDSHSGFGGRSYC